MNPWAVAVLSIVLSACGASAQQPSLACAVEYTRMQAIVASDYANSLPEASLFIVIDGKSVGPLDIFEVKRRYLKGQIGAETLVAKAGQPAWGKAAEEPYLQTLRPIGPFQPDGGADAQRRHFAGCWVSDDLAMAAPDTERLMLQLFENGTFIPYRRVKNATTGKEGFWFSFKVGEPWSVTPKNGKLELDLPGVAYFDKTSRIELRRDNDYQFTLIFSDGIKRVMRRM
jgi:hypothetical protein